MLAQAPSARNATACALLLKQASTLGGTDDAAHTEYLQLLVIH